MQPCLQVSGQAGKGVALEVKAAFHTTNLPPSQPSSTLSKCRKPS